MLNFGASNPMVKGGPDPRGPPGSPPALSYLSKILLSLVLFIFIVTKTKSK